jgi:predicted PurR-regulated permease PerM
MLLATTFLTFLWSLIVIFFMVIFFILLFHVIIDLFSRHDASGWKKTAWVIFLIVFPFLGLFVYYITNSQGMAERQMKVMKQQQTQMDDYIKSVSSSSDPTQQIAQAKALLDAGSITQTEFETLKAKALA